MNTIKTCISYLIPTITKTEATQIEEDIGKIFAMDTLTNGMWILGSLTYLATSSYHHSLNGRVSLIAQRNEYNLNASKGFIDITQYLRTTILATLILNKASIEVSKACGFEKHIKFPILAVGALTLSLYPFSWLPNPSIYSIEDFIPNNQF